MKFINIVGTTASGKTTFARQLAKQLNLFHIELDDLFWLDGWKESSDEAFFAKLKFQMDNAENGWVIDGNYTRTTALKWQNVDTVIWLDYSFRLNLYRSVKRALIRTLSQHPLWKSSNNRETFSRSFLSKDSIILWMIQHHAKNHQRYVAMMQDSKYQHIQFIRLTSPRQAQAFLKRLSDFN